MIEQYSTVDDGTIEDVQKVRTFYYELLARLFMTEPSGELIDFITDGLETDAWPLLDEHPLLNEGSGQMKKVLRSRNVLKRDLFEAIHWDYTRLFVGPFELPAPPWASAYRHEGRMLFQDETLQVRKAYAKYGYQVEEAGREAEDHIGYELNFMANIVNEFTSKRHEETGRDLLKDQAIFLEQHLMTWVPEFTKDVRKADNSDFYKAAANLLEGWLVVDRMLLDNLHQTISLSH